MDDKIRWLLEQDVHHLFEAGDLDGAVTAAMRGFGPELFEFLHALHRDPDDAKEVFSRLAEAIWRSFPSFRWSSSFRTWAYVIANRVSNRYRREGRRRATWEVRLPEESSLSILVPVIVAETLSFMRTQRRTRLLALREALPVADQVLLMLRVDRALSWKDLARVLHREEGEHEGEESELEDEELARAAARLRQRFQTVKEKLYEMARREGLLDSK